MHSPSWTCPVELQYGRKNVPLRSEPWNEASETDHKPPAATGPRNMSRLEFSQPPGSGAQGLASGNLPGLAEVCWTWRPVNVIIINGHLKPPGLGVSCYTTFVCNEYTKD